MTNRPNPIPLRPFLPEDAPATRTKAFWRALTAIALAKGKSGDSAETIVQRMWSRDEMAFAITRAAVSPTSTSSTAILPTVIAGFLSGIAPQSAAARLFTEALRVELRGIHKVLLPRMSTALPVPVFVAEAGPIPVVSGAFANIELGPASKMAFMTAITNELAERSDAEAIVRTAMSETAGKAFDAAVFSTTAASAIRPAGLLNGVTPITATAGGGFAALEADIKALVGAIATAGGGSNVWLFANPVQAVTIKLATNSSFDVPVIPTPALASGTLVAVEIGAIASGYSGVPEISASGDVAVHMEGANPAHIGITTGSTPPTAVSAPVLSAYQANLLVLKLILRCSWATRAPGMVQYVESATW